MPKGSLKTDGLYGLWIFMMSKEFLIQGAIATSPNYFLMPCLPADEQLWQWPWCSPWASVSSAEQVDSNKCLRHIKRPLKIPDFFYWNLVEAPLWRQKYCMPKINLAGCKSKIVKETGRRARATLSQLFSHACAPCLVLINQTCTAQVFPAQGIRNLF